MLQKIDINWQNLPSDLFIDIYEIAQEIGIHKIAIVGGFVRDILLRSNKQDNLINSKDLDLVVEGSAPELALAIKNKLGKERAIEICIHSDFNTAEIKIDNFPVDLASARSEIYLKPGDNPKIKRCSLNEDLRRRDFTINAMAIDLSNMELLDPYGGKTALLNKEIQFLHPKSVEEDPTRVIRAARYSARFLFNLTPQDLEQVQSTLLSWPWAWKQGDSFDYVPPALGSRLRMELERLFNQEPWEVAFSFLQSWGGLVLLDTYIQEDQYLKRRIRWAFRLGLKPLTALLVGSKNSLTLAKRLQLSKQQQDLIDQSEIIKKFLLKSTVKNEYLCWSPSQWTSIIESQNWHPDAVALAICNANPMWRKLLKWWNRWRFIKSPISAKELIKIGWEPGPKLGKHLQKLRREKLDNYKNQY